MAVNPNEDTEFNDALRKFGIIPQREKTPPSPSPPPSPTVEQVLQYLTPGELDELGEKVTDDDVQRMIESSKRQRIAQERREQRLARFGRVYPIGRDDYTREVTAASSVDEEGDDEHRGTRVVCFLYKDGIPRSNRAFDHIRTLAARHPRTKFVSIVGDKCIPHLSDALIPMLVIYRKGELRNQITQWGADRERSLKELEAFLVHLDAIDPQDPPFRDSKDDDNDDDDRMGSTNTRSAKNIRGPAKGNDSDSDFEFDM